MFLSRIFTPRDIRPRRHRSRIRISVEALEGRQLLATFTVTNVNDSGPGSLRNAILSSNAAAGSTGNTINFDIGNGGVQTIALLSPLPAVTHAVTIDGATQPGCGSAPRIVLDGTDAGSGASGLTLDKSFSAVEGVALVNFGEYGILVDGGSSNTIAGDFIGLTPAGTADGNVHDGIVLCNDAHLNTVTGNVISGNGANGVEICADSDGNVVTGNLVGTNAGGTAAVPNGGDGVKIESGANDNTIGGTAAGAGNVISGNEARGVEITEGSDGNVIAGNSIGTNSAGNAALGNADTGVLISHGANGNTVGGTTAAAQNVIAANGGDGVHVTDGSYDNVIEGNLIGANTAALGNAQDGVLIDAGSAGTVVGGTAAGAGNTIVNNLDAGVVLNQAGTGNVVEGNAIDSNGFGQPAAGLGDGVSVMCSPGATVAGNTIALNRDWGICVADSNQAVLTGNVFQDNGLGGVE